MKGYRFDPSRLACTPTQQTRQGYAVAADMLREYLGGSDIYAEVRERVRRDPQLQAASQMLAPVGDQTPRRGRRRPRRPRRLR